MENKYSTNYAPPVLRQSGVSVQQFNSADEQLREAMNILHTSLKYSTTIPNYAIRQWCDLLANPQTQMLSGLKNVIKQIRADCERLNLTQLQNRNPRNGGRFIEQMATIESNLDWIIEIVDHMTTFMQKHRRLIKSSTI